MKHPRLGAHMSIAGGPAKALTRGASIHCDAIQMFVRGPNRWAAPELKDKQVEAFHAQREATGIQPIITHSAYLINLGSSDEALWDKSLGVLVDELERCERLGTDGHVLHPGSHKGAGVKIGMANIARGLSEALELTTSARILLEITAGMGASIGHTFEELAEIRERCGNPERIGVCLDTAHALAAGYEFRGAESYAEMWRQFDDIIGLEHLGAIHLNDSKKDLGTRVDRHEQIGEGYVGLGAFRLLMNDQQLAHVPMLLETPKGQDLAEDVRNLALLRSLFAD